MSDLATHPAPLVSVIVPVFNRKAKIRECVKSVCEQTHRPIELIVVDDGSTDATPTALERLKNELGNNADPNFSIRVFRQSNAGAPAARNRGMREARGSWIQFLDSDDALLPSKIANGIATARRSNSEIVYSKAQFVNSSGERIDRYWGRRLSGDWRDCFEFSWQTMCAIYSRKALDVIGEWNENLTVSQDWEYCIRAVTSGLLINFLDQVEASYTCEGDDRIGSSLSGRKPHGRELALWAVFAHLSHRRLMCPKLRRRFRSQLLHAFLSYRASNEIDRSTELLQRMVDQYVISNATSVVLRKVAGRQTSEWLLTEFERRRSS